MRSFCATLYLFCYVNEAGAFCWTFEVPLLLLQGLFEFRMSHCLTGCYYGRKKAGTGIPIFRVVVTLCNKRRTNLMLPVLLGYDTAFLFNWPPTFRDNLVIYLQGSKCQITQWRCIISKKNGCLIDTAQKKGGGGTLENLTIFFAELVFVVELPSVAAASVSMLMDRMVNTKSLVLKGKTLYQLTGIWLHFFMPFTQHISSFIAHLVLRQTQASSKASSPESVN